MIAAFEQRLAEVLGDRLPPPFGGRVSTAPLPGAGPSILLGITDILPAGTDFGAARRPEVTTRNPDRRLRVLRLALTIELRVIPADPADRAEAMEGLERALYLSEAADLTTGVALRVPPPEDPGFQITRLSVLDARPPRAGDADGAAILHLLSEGWFWPTEIPGETGAAIQDIRLRTALLPLRLVGAAGPLVAGGPAVALKLESDAAGEMRLRADASPSQEPFGTLSLALRRPDGSAGTGTLSGGTDGPGGTRLVPLTADGAAFGYTPPPTPGQEELLIRLTDPDGNPRGSPLGHFPLRTGPG
ncbi:hypothetical protein J8J14_13730 [Roseomonas sp. SSH11]|uniref:Uncharacterized protein n=1 Tax=Pararoseomonas baculiformis TaxID=2820812 RepID=A0ABS4AFP6_9PROT|nr:hypothetical protein [Pararoseomonas baculiformis]MBP0445835.1 hypothetical protein [Pararoseomonas baculiformis]